MTNVRTPSTTTRLRWVLGLTSAAYFMVVLDSLVVITALPQMQRDLHASLASLQWTGRIYHSALEADGEIEVFDIWESQEALEKWGPEGFVPVLVDLGVELNPPTIHPVHNVIPA